jgi:hypothetical protein
VAGIRDQHLGIPAPTHETHDPRSDSGLVHALADTFNDTRKLEARYVGWSTGRGRIRAPALEQVRPVESGPVDFDAHLTRSWNRFFQVGKLEYVGLSWPDDANRFHAVIPPGYQTYSTGRSLDGSTFAPGPLPGFISNLLYGPAGIAVSGWAPTTVTRDRRTTTV